MRDHYVGDISDLLKFALLRALAEDDKVLGIAWYYAEGNDKSEDGRHLEWQDDPNWKSFDPLLHTWLSGLERNVEALEDPSFWPQGTLFHREPITMVQRESWLRNKRERLAAANLVFLDPDNGIGRPSKKHAAFLEVAALRRVGRTIGFITFPHQSKKHQEQVTELHARIAQERERLESPLFASPSLFQISRPLGSSPEPAGLRSLILILF